jgi:predicted ribosome quality control (RQC) complex YloA/Tae2 family protein
MDDESINKVAGEIEPLIIGRASGKIFQLGPQSMAFDFRLRDQGYLFVCIEPAQPRLYLVKRRTRDLEKQSAPLSQFALALRKELSNTTVRSIKKDAGDRVVRFAFGGRDELGREIEYTLIVQLTGRSANLFLLDRFGVIAHRARPTQNPGQQVGEVYQRPHSQTEHETPKEDSKLLRTIRGGRFDSPSAAADEYFTSLLSQQTFDARSGTARAELRKKISQQKKLLQQLQKDLAGHADGDRQKRMGDLLLANLSTAKRTANRVVLIDYFAADQASIEVEVDENLTLQDEAARRFASYSRSKRAVQQIGLRIDATRAEVAELDSQLEGLEEIIGRRDDAALETFINRGSVPSVSAGGSGGSKRKPEKKIPGTRRYLSSDGFEILVGRTARDNDQLTFKVAKPNDLWLHAADYGGSHVVVRNSTRKEIPHRTIIEAAQLAAQFSQARKDPKVDVHYTERKFVSKSKGSAPGLVRLTRFKNITVEPKEAIERI